MIHYNYSPLQLEVEAEKLLRRFDPERLEGPKPIDVYAVIEKCLDVPYDWKYLTPDQSVLGMTAFEGGFLWIWPKPYYEDGMFPFQIEVEKNSILIDATLTESDNRGRENFTVMHEVFHQILPHNRCFSSGSPDYTHRTTKNVLAYRRRKSMSSLEICEYQANACAAAFLMPKDAVLGQVRAYTNAMLHLSDSDDWNLTRTLAAEFNVSSTAMRYRLLNLKLAIE